MDYHLTYLSLRSSVCSYIKPELFKEALEYLTTTSDVDGWIVMLKGA